MYPRNQPLPANTYDLSTQATFHKAYEHCLALETAAAGANNNALLFARCLGYLIRELPYEAGKVVTDHVKACNSDEDMRDLSQIYIDRLIRPFWRPDTSDFIPLPIDDDVEVDILISKALERDSYRCAVTGYAEFSCMQLSLESRRKYNLTTPGVASVTTRYCDILPPWTDWNFDDNDLTTEKRKWTSLIWAITESFGVSVTDLIKAQNEPTVVHDLMNGFMISMDLNLAFNKLCLWFEHLPNHSQPNTYRVHAAIPLAILYNHPPHHTFTFKSTDPSLPVPRFAYLQFHAAMCRVAHLSGVLDYFFSETVIVGNLAHDGSSASVLATRLRRLAHRALSKGPVHG